jgi:nucleoside phosphorylase
MPSRPGTRRATLVVAAALAAVVAAPARGAPGGGLCAAVSDDPSAPRIAVLSAFPAELAPLVAAARVDETSTVDGRTYYLGTLDGVRVVLGLLGIGLVNASTTAESVLDRFDPVAIVVSGVAGSPERIGDVIVPTAWTLEDERRRVRANPALVQLAREAARTAVLERCTEVPTSGMQVCLGFNPAIVVGGRGHSEDPFGGAAFPCTPGGDDVFGCEVPTVAPRAVAREPEAEDMETAAVAHAARRRRVPYVAFRAVSDGAGDPLGLPGFPAQFFAYYRLAAHNAAAGTRAFLVRLAGLPRARGARRRICALLARRRWRRVATLLRRHPARPRNRTAVRWRRRSGTAREARGPFPVRRDAPAAELTSPALP